MKKNFIFLLIIILATSCFIVNTNNENSLAKIIKVSELQYLSLINEIGNSKKNPRSITKDNRLKLVTTKDWTSGFFPGALWYLFEFTNKDYWKNQAERFTERLETEKFNNRTHDMGFKMYCSFGNGYRLTKNEKYKKILLKSAQTLATRFNSKVGCIRSWDFNKEVWQFPVIIDNMMNLELLFWATEISGDSTYYNIAISHANSTLKNHFRKNYSSWHVVNYDTLTGEVLSKETHQGYSNKSSWSRGQAWGLYGFTMCYRETGNKKYLTVAKNIASYILKNKNMPADGIPYWDFDAPNIPTAKRDASAAAIIASALYELSEFVYEKSETEYYKNNADKIINALSSKDYFAKENNHGFLLKHSVGNMPKMSEVDVPIIYADYYFLEANLRRLKITNKH